MFRLGFLLAILSVFAIVPLAIAANDPVITVQISANRVTATGVTPRGDVVFFGRSLEWRGGVRHLRRHAVVLNDQDRDGIVTLAVDENIPTFSTWVIVDFDSGVSVIASPAGFTPKRIELPSVVWRGGVSYVDLTREYLDVLFVRPKVGAWRAEMWQGGSRDADGRNDAKVNTGSPRKTALSVPPVSRSDGSTPTPV